MFHFEVMHYKTMPNYYYLLVIIYYCYMVCYNIGIGFSF